MLVAALIRRAPTRATPDDALSVEGLYRAHARRVSRWAQRLGGPAVDPEEALQEVFITVNRRLPELRAEEALISWLFRITAGIVANQRRASQRRRFRWAFLSPAVVDLAASGAPGPAELLERREVGERFYRVLDRLSENHRSVLVLFELDEMSTEEIAVLVERPPATVRVWLHRARAAFSKHWHRDVEREHRRTQRGRGGELP